MPIDTSFIPDVPSHAGPLNDYRKKASFDWKMLRIYFESEEGLRIKSLIWDRLEKDPLFRKPPVTPSVDDQKKLAAMRMKRVAELGFLTNEIKNLSYQKRVNDITLSDYLEPLIYEDFLSQVEIHDYPK